MKYYIKTFGCQMNYSDSERMMTFFDAHGFQPLVDQDDRADQTRLKHENEIALPLLQVLKQADLVIFNTCGVRETAENRVFTMIHKIRSRRSDSIIVITGCLAHRKDVQRKMKDKVVLFLPIADFQEIFSKFGQVFENKLGGNVGITNEDLRFMNNAETLQNDKATTTHHSLFSPPKRSDGDPTTHYLCLRPKYKYTDEAFVPIMTGCNNFCSYCVVPYARGREWSRSAQDVVNEIATLAKNGCKKVTLLGQNVNSYKFKVKSEKLKVAVKNSKFENFDIEKMIGNPPAGEAGWKLPAKGWSALGGKIGNSHTVKFPMLLDLLATQYPNIHFTFITSHPKDYSEELVRVIAKNKNIDRRIHLPMQAGSDRILKLMNRPYTQAHYLSLIEMTKKIIPEAKFSTDVIIGFPGETEADFAETMKVVDAVKFHEVFLNKYSPRPGTASFKLGDPISWDEKKRRENILRAILTSSK